MHSYSAEYISKFYAGDKSLFNELFVRLVPEIGSRIRSRLDEDAFLDVCQEACMRLYFEREKVKFSDGMGPETYFYMALRNCWSAYFKSKHANGHVYFEGGADGIDEIRDEDRTLSDLDEHQLRYVINQAFDSLKGWDRLLVYAAGWDMPRDERNKMIQQLLKKPTVNAASTAVSRAVAKYSEALKSLLLAELVQQQTAEDKE